MKQSIAALLVGIIFGLGLTVSEMISPAKVISFLDIAGAWDPSLMLVMGSALVIAGVGFRLVFQRTQPMFAERFRLPDRQDIDARLVTGSALFGVGWGLSGLCPGPALAAFAIAGDQILIFLAAMGAGILLYRLVNQRLVADPVLAPDG